MDVDFFLIVNIKFSKCFVDVVSKCVVYSLNFMSNRIFVKFFTFTINCVDIYC